MENFLKIMATLLSVILVGSAYPALVWGLFQKPAYWILYLLCLIAILGCIRAIKNIQHNKTK